MQIDIDNKELNLEEQKFLALGEWLWKYPMYGASRSTAKFGRVEISYVN
jgi:hypothetical protein